MAGEAFLIDAGDSMGDMGRIGVSEEKVVVVQLQLHALVRLTASVSQNIIRYQGAGAYG